MKTPDYCAIPDTPGGFRRRYYSNFRQYLSELYYLIKHTPAIVFKYYRLLPADFRERLMLTVTAVNQCRYCRDFHYLMAARAGIKLEEAYDINNGKDCDTTPENQRPALEYARQWALDGGDFKANAMQKLSEHYDESTITAIELAIRGIWIGNLSGNTWDYWLYRLTFGRLGQ